MPREQLDVRKVVVAASLFTVLAAFACSDGTISGVVQEPEDVGQAALAGYVTSQMTVLSADGAMSVVDSTRGRVEAGALRFDARLTPRVSQAPLATNWATGRLRRPTGREKVVTKRDSSGVRHTAVLVLDPNDSTAPPKFVLRFVNGKPVDAMQMRFQRVGGRWALVGADFALFDTATGRGA